MLIKKLLSAKGWSIFFYFIFLIILLNLLLYPQIISYFIIYTAIYMLIRCREYSTPFIIFTNFIWDVKHIITNITQIIIMTWASRLLWKISRPSLFSIILWFHFFINYKIYLKQHFIYYIGGLIHLVIYNQVFVCFCYTSLNAYNDLFVS